MILAMRDASLIVAIQFPCLSSGADDNHRDERVVKNLQTMRRERPLKNCFAAAQNFFAVNMTMLKYK
jgi:hypothetical protein